MDCIFCKIANKEIPKEFVYEDEDVMVFSDIKPIKPVHILIMPKKHVPELLDADPVLFEKLGLVMQLMVRKEGLENKGYRIIVNGGGAQIVNHLHLHLTGPWAKAEKI